MSKSKLADRYDFHIIRYVLFIAMLSIFVAVAFNPIAASILFVLFMLNGVVIKLLWHKSADTYKKRLFAKSKTNLEKDLLESARKSA